MSCLQSLCLNFIVENIEQFNFAFKKSKNVNLQQNLEFLRRQYSDYLAKKLLQRNNEDIDKYFDFLINEHLTHVKFSWFERSHYLDYVDDIFCRLQNLRKIQFISYGNEVLKSVAKFCPNVVAIKASYSDLTDKGIKYICGIKSRRIPCPNLKRIFIRRSLVTDKGVKYLFQYLPFLEIIDIENIPQILFSIHKKKLSKSLNKHCYNLQELDLRGCADSAHFTDVLKTCLIVCPNLNTFYCLISKEEQLEVFNFNHLKKLDLKCTEMKKNINISNIFKNTGCNLIDLRIDNCSVSLSVLAEHCRALKVLHVVQVQFTDVDDVQTTFPSLTECYFDRYLVEKIPFLFSLSPKLEILSFSWCTFFFKLQEEFLIWLRNSAVKDIRFLNLSVEIKFLKDILLNCHSLKKLSFIQCACDISNPKETLEVLAESLPNRPIISKYNIDF